MRFSSTNFACKNFLLNINLIMHFLSIDVTALRLSPFGGGTGPIHLDDVRCVGFEDALVNCTYDPNTADCLHFEDAGVRCRRKFENTS